MFGPPKETKQLRAGAAQTGGALLQFLQPGAAQAFLGRTGQLLPEAGQSLLDLIEGGGEAAGQRVIGAAQPVFEENLRFAQGGLASSAASPFSTAFAQQGIDLSSRALRDFNLFQAQQLAGGQERAINAASILAQLVGAEQQGPLAGLAFASDFFAPIAAKRAQDRGFGGFLQDLLKVGVQGGAAGAAGRI